MIMSNFSESISRDVFFNENLIREIASKKLLNDSVNIEKTIEWSRVVWESKARSHIATSKEKVVPIRLIPVGSRVKFTDRAGLSNSGLVGTPKVNSLGEVVARYRDHQGDWHYVSGDTLLETITVNPTKTLSPRWKKENNTAKKLESARLLYAMKKQK